EAWPHYEWRWKIGAIEPPRLSQPRWMGEDLAGKTILVHAEQGLGDTLQFIRYAPLLRQRGARVIVQCQWVLASLIATCEGVDAAHADLADAGHFDTQAPLLSLPGLFKTTLESVPARTPYLFPRSVLVDSWRSKLAPRDQVVVGIVWRGSPSSWFDFRRSI